ncbi:MAG: thermonuclease family protein [Hyphomicrobiaceae bacterium]
MFRWKKRDEGFEWHQYVRTTIKLRREARREKAQKLGEQVAGSARAAGAAADELAKNSARRLGDVARAAAIRGGHGAATALRAAGRGLRSLAGSLGGLLGGFLAGFDRLAIWPAIDLLGRPGVSGPLTFVGVIAAVAGAVRTFMGSRGLDFEAGAALGIGVVCLVLGIGPSLRLGHAVLPRRTMAPIGGLPSRPWLIAACVGIAALVGSIGVAVTPVSMPSVSFPRVASLETFSLMRAETVSGKAQVLGADTVRVERRKIRLKGIVVPDPGQRCLRSGARAGGRTWACGHDAREALQRLVNGRTIKCEIGSGSADDVVAGRCETKGEDVAELLVKAGFAFAEGSFLSAYSSAEGAAKDSKAGIWSSAAPERPAQWRDRLWAEAKQQAPEGCPIKGRVRGRERVYLLPWDANYSRVRIRKRRGERWFCTQDEAEAAGWHNPSRG